MVEKGSTAVGDQGGAQEWREVIVLRQGHAFSGNSSFGCSQRSWQSLGVMCRHGGARPTGQASKFGLFLMFGDEVLRDASQ